MPPPPPTEMTCIGCENVLVLLWNHGLAVPILELGLPPLEFLNHSRGEVDLLVPRLKLCENSLLKMKKRPNV